MKSLLILTLLCAFLPARAGYLPKGDTAAAGARNIVLIYNGGTGHLKWQPADFQPLLSLTTTSRTSRLPFFDTLLFLPLVARSGHGYLPGFGTGPSDRTDWDDYISNSLFGGEGHLSHLDAEATQVKAAIHTPGYRWKVILTLPYPDPLQRSFGAVTTDGASLDFSRTADRLAALQWYIGTVSARWKAAAFQNLDLVGLYWVQELVSGSDGTLLPQVAVLVHADGRKFFWIPYYNAAGASRWKTWGFDAAIYQPNYYFSSTLPVSRLTDTAAFARTYGMGFEMEMDGDVLSSAASRARYQAYIDAGASEGFQRGAVTAWYMGGAGLRDCAWSSDPTARAVYDNTWNFVLHSGLPGDAEMNRIVDAADVKAVLRLANGSRSSTDPTLDTGNADVDRSGRADVRDAVLLLRSLSGLNALP